MFKKKDNGVKEIQFFPKDLKSKVVASKPLPAKKHVPDWYKRAPKYAGGTNIMSISDNGAANTGIKSCTPFLDSLIFGYMITTFCDILIRRHEDGMPYAVWSSDSPPVSGRTEDVYSFIPNPPGFSPFCLAFELTHGFILPKGYSVLITQPFNNYELNTYLSTGIIDADDALQPGGIPFAVRDGFEGIIPAGTPFAQMFPFKRDDWNSVDIEYTAFENNISSVPRTLFTGWYKKNLWKKKDFN